MRLFLCLSLFFVFAACGDDARGCVVGTSIACTCTNGATGAQVCEANGGYGACVCGGQPRNDSGALPFDGGGRFDGGPSATGETCILDRSQFLDVGECLVRYEGCTNSFTYFVECRDGTCTCRENDLPGASFPTVNYCGDITPEFQASLTSMNCGWDWTLR